MTAIWHGIRDHAAPAETSSNLPDSTLPERRSSWLWRVHSLMGGIMTTTINAQSTASSKVVSFSLSDRVAQIRSCFLFSAAKEDTLHALASESHVENCAANQAIFAVSDDADGLRVVLSGEVRIWLADEEGREMTLSFMRPGDFFGEIALMDGLTRSANATALGETQCLFIPVGAVESIMEQDIGLAKHIIFSLCELMRRNVGTISALAFASLDARLAKVLYDLALDYAQVDNNRAVFSRKFSQSELALMLGVTREAVNKRLKILEREGFIALHSSGFVIPDLTALLARTKRKAR